MKFFSSLKMYQAKSGVKNFSLYMVGVGEVSLCEIFFPIWTCIKPDGVTKNLPFYTMCLSSLFKEL